MIMLTKLNGIPFVLNSDLIETVLQNPDTTVRLTDGNVYIVKESMQELIEKVINYKKQIYRGTITTQGWDN